MDYYLLTDLAATMGYHLAMSGAETFRVEDTHPPHPPRLRRGVRGVRHPQLRIRQSGGRQRQAADDHAAHRLPRERSGKAGEAERAEPPYLRGAARRWMRPWHGCTRRWRPAGHTAQACFIWGMCWWGWASALCSAAHCGTACGRA